MYNKLRTLVLAFGAAILMTAPVQAITVNFDESPFSLLGTLTETNGDLFEGFVTLLSTSGSQVSPPDAQLSPTNADGFFDITPGSPGFGSSPAHEAAALNTLLGTNTFTTGTQHTDFTQTSDSTGDTFATLTVDTLYFSIKVDGYWAFFKNTSGALLNLEWFDPKLPPTGPGNIGAGLSHYTTFGASVVPIPPAIILFLTGLAGIGWLGRRKRRAVA